CSLQKMSNSSAMPDASDDVTKVRLRSLSSSRTSPMCLTSTPQAAIESNSSGYLSFS
ncbi:MAG: hypothetical protein AVDCRST_MAG93-4858, partial [uncultured Chloroflexia bacterium]